MRSPRTVEMHYGTLRRGLPVGSSSSRCHHAVEISSRSQPPRASDPRDPIRILVKFFMHEFYCTAVHVLVVVPGGGSLLAFRLPARVYRWGGRVGVSTLEIHVLSYF